MNKTRVYKDKYAKECYNENFYNVTDEPYKLTTKGFNDNSSLKIQSYRNYFNLIWIDVLKMYNKYDDLYNYILNEYKEYIINTGKQNIQSFCKAHEYLNIGLLNSIGIDKVMADCNVKKLRYTEQDYIDNFNEIMTKQNKIPLYTEFKELTKITLNSYALHYSLKCKVYDNLVKLMCSEDEYNGYLIYKTEHKSSVGKETGKLSLRYTLEELQNEFIRVFEYCMIEFHTYPSRKIFNMISKFDDSVYRNRLNKSWTNICKHYGYEVRNKNIMERVVLSKISNIVEEDFIPQKTWSWLIGVNNKNLFCDGYFPEHNLVVEFDGKQHRKPMDCFGGDKSFKNVQQNDKIKDNLIKENGMIMLRIDSRSKWYDDQFLKDQLDKVGVRAS